MKLDKAIEINKDIKQRGSRIDDPDDNNAIQLGIEALKGIKAVRELHPELSPFPLPGETDE